MFRISAALFAALITTISLFTSTAPPAAIACSGDPERFDDLVRAADVIAIVHAEYVGVAFNAQPTIQPTFTPFPLATPPPYRLEDLSGIGAKLRVVATITHTADAFIEADWVRRTRIESHERSLEAQWPGLASSCSVAFMTHRYEVGADYLALYRWTGSELETTRLVSIQGEDVEEPWLGVSVDAYDRYFADLKADVERPVLDETYGYAFLRDFRMPLDRFESIVRTIRFENPTIAPPDTGSGGLKPPR